MLSKKQYFGLMTGKLNIIAFLPLVIAVIIAVTGCSPTEGSVVILENTEENGCTIKFKEWSEENKCELQLNKGDELFIEVSQDSGKIALSICGKNGNKSYTGKDLETCSFSVTISETDVYTVHFSGTNATGQISIHY